MISTTHRRNAVTEIRSSLCDPRALCAALGLTEGARPQRGGVMVRCPFHDERTPSCSVSTGPDGTIRVHCFGCDASGDVFTLIAAVRGLDVNTHFREVLAEAARLAGVQIASELERPELTRPSIHPGNYHALISRLIELCPFVEEPDVLAYTNRRILIVEGAKAQLAGLPPPSAQGGLIATLLQTFEVETLVLAGLVGVDSRTGNPNLERLAFPENRLAIPWRDRDGRIAVLQRRRLDDHGPKYVFPTGMRPALPFGAEKIHAAQARTLVFVEGALDVLALRLLDVRDKLGILPLGLPGLSGWRPEWAQFAKERVVYIGFDADAAGDRATNAVAADSLQAGATKVVRWAPRGAKDWAERMELGVPLPGAESSAA